MNIRIHPGKFYRDYFLDTKDGVYLVAYGYMMLSKLWDASAATGNNPFRYTFIVTVLLLICEFFNGTRKSFIYTMLFAGIGFATIKLVGIPVIGHDALIGILFLYTGRAVPFHRIGNFTIGLCSLLVLIIVGASYLGILPNYTSPGRIREGLGFIYPLFFPAYLLNITSLVIYLRRSLSYSALLFLLAINVFAYMKCDGRISFFCAIILLSGAVILKILKPDGKKMHSFFSASIFCYPVCLVFSFLLTLLYGMKNYWQWINFLDNYLGGRLHLGYEGLINYGIRPFYQSVKWIGGGDFFQGKRVLEPYNWVDNMYIRFFIDNGYVIGIIFFVFLTISTYIGWKRKDYVFLLVMLTCAVHGLLDDSKLELTKNTFLFLSASLFYNEGPKMHDKLKYILRGITDKMSSVI